MADKPIGERYSRVYIEPKPKTDDSDRARARVGHYLRGHLSTVGDSVVARSCRETFGDGPDYMGMGGHDWSPYVAALSLEDFLDLITVAHKAIAERLRELGLSGEEYKRLNDFSAGWVPFCRQVFGEESLAYQIDDYGGIHPLVDEEFQLAKQSLIAALNEPRFAGAKACFDDAHRHFGSRPPDTKAAIRSMFECVETLFQVHVSGKLNRGNIENKLVPLLQQQNASDDPDCWKAIGASLSDWTDAFHRYRHGQDEEAPRTPSMQLCTYALSSGAALARMLAETA